MIRTRLLAPLAATLLLAAGALAQPSDSEATTTAPAEQPAGTTIDKSVVDVPDRAPASVEKSPSDYRASEKISEDRPVSFPVDI